MAGCSSNVNVVSETQSFSMTHWKFHVFLSFRGEDTRLSFTDHLYAALQRNSIITFRDEEELEKGEVISQNILQAIEESSCAVVIISQGYASSTWCLDELLKILESKHALGQEVFPVFYGVDPSDVRHQRGSFAEAFEKHEEKFTNDKEKVQKWRDALKEVANLSGWDSKDMHETELIEEIVARVWTKLAPKLPSYTDVPIAIERRLEDMESLILLGLKDVRFIGIWGMGGIGKTTLASVVFKKISCQFDISCFLPNVREISGEYDGLVRLQKKLLSQSKTKGEVLINTSDQGKDIIRNLLHNRKVLLVLDDVSTESQLENLAGNQEWFGPGSRVIVTTRDKHLLISHRVPFQMYEAKILNNDESLKLFCENAFKGDHHPEEDYFVLSKDVVKYAGGLPLALVVLGSILCGRSVHEWIDVLDKIKQLPHDDILNKLRISYDMLEDEYKTIFLDIACFFKGWQTYTVTEILKCCGLHPTIGINVLVEKSLITLDETVLGMHDLLEEMGRSIVFQESPNDPGRRSRLWSVKDIDQVLTKNKGTESVQGIVLKPSSSSKSYEARWDPEAFSKMCNLRLLIILCDLHLPLGLKCLSSSLKVLIWLGYPLEALPLGVQLNELVRLEMDNSKVKQLWSGIQHLRKLEFIRLSGSSSLIQTPNISGVPNLKTLLLRNCSKLVEVHESIGQHKKFEILNLMECTNLKVLPRKLEMSSLSFFYLSRCSKVAKLPEFGENMESVSEILLHFCKNLLCLPNTIGNLKSLRVLNISDCSKVSSLPESIDRNKALEYLDLSGTGIREFSSSLFCLENLKRLTFSRCTGPAFNSWWKFQRHAVPTSLKLPPSISGLSSLEELDLSYCNLSDESIPAYFGCLSSLERLVLSGNNFVNLSSHCFANLSKLRCLELEDCPRLQSLPKLPLHVRLNFGCSQNQIDAFLLDPEMLWNHSESPEDKMKDWLHPLEFTPESRLTSFYSMASIKVNMPAYCCSDQWRGFWGIVVCLAFEPMNLVPDTEKRFIFYIKTLDPEALQSCWGTTVSSTGYMFNFFMSGNFIHLHGHCKGDTNKGFLLRYRKGKFSENSKLFVEVKTEGCKLEIRNCRWHVLREEDMEELRKLMTVKLRARKISRKQFLVEDASAVNENRGFLSGRLFNRSMQGLCLTALTLVSVMVGFRVFILPRKGSKLCTTSRNASDETMQLPRVSQSHTTSSAVHKSQLTMQTKHNCRHETELTEEIVAQVWSKLEPKLPSYTDVPIAIERRLEDMESLLLLGLKDVRFIGI